jgi:hypothetical protein
MLGTNPMDADDATVDQWLEMMVDGRADMYAWHDERRAQAILDAARPVLDARGTAARRGSFYHVLGLGRVIRSRFRVDEADIANLRESVAAAEETGIEKDIGYAACFLGWLLWARGELTAAQEELNRALALAERIGEAVLLERSLVHLAFIAVRRHDTEAVRLLAHRALTVAPTAASRDSATDASALLVWLAWQDQQPHEVIALAEQIARGDPHTTYHVPQGITPHKWVCLFPLLAAHLTLGDVAAAVGAARQLLARDQQRYPDELESALALACRAWAHGGCELAIQQLTTARTLAGDLHYL